MTLSRAELDGPIAAAAATTVRSWRFRIWLAIATVWGVGAATLPLIGVLGYELAVLSSVVVAIAAVDLGATLVRRTRASPPPPLSVATSPMRLVAELVVRAAAIAVVVALVPGVIAAIHGIWAITCDWGFGIEAYLALPLATAVLFAGLGVAVGLVTAHRRILGQVAPFLVVLAIAAGGLYRFYSEPPVFSYNPIIGYFPGNLYDEDVTLGMPLVWARLETVAWVVGLLALCAAQLDAPRFRVALREIRPRELRTGAWLAAGLALTAAVALQLAGGVLGHGVDAEDIQAELGGRIETPHFVIYYARTPDIDRNIAVIAADHEFRYAQVAARIGVTLDGKIDSYYFASREQKAAWFGARQVDMAKPWRREIYLDHRDFPHGALRHEIAHIVAGEFGSPIFAVSARHVVLINPGLIEGLAVAIDWPDKYDRTLTPHQQMRVIQALGREPNVDDLLSLRFLSIASARSYIAAGSFLRFLLDRYGAPPLRALYETGGDFPGAYGKTMRALVAEWRAFLATVAIPSGAVEASRERLDRGSVFERPCPHATAERKQQASQASAEGDRPRAIRLMRQVCADQPGDPRNRLALSGYLDDKDASPAEHAEARALWRALAGPAGRSTSVQVDALVALADDAAARGDGPEVYRLTLEALRLPVEDGARRLVLVRWLALNHVGPSGPLLRAFYLGRTGGSWRALMAIAVGVEPAFGLTHYLLGLVELEGDDYALAARDLARGLDRGLPGPLFVRNAARKLAVAAFRAGDVGGVQRAIDVLAAPGMTEVDRLLGIDWQERLAFTSTGKLPATSR